MKPPLLLLISTLATAGSVTLPIVGCASSTTQRSTGEFVDDGSITAKVKAALLGDEQVSGRAVSVQTYRGTVQLSGFVDNAAEKTRAEEIARTIQGVQVVENRISIKPAAQNP